MICKHCGHDTDAAVTRSVVVDVPGHPVAAVCAIGYCELATVLRAIAEHEGCNGYDCGNCIGAITATLADLGIPVPARK